MVAETLLRYAGGTPPMQCSTPARPYLGNRIVDANINAMLCERRQALGLLVPVGSVHYCLPPPAYQPSVLLGALPG